MYLVGFSDADGLVVLHHHGISRRTSERQLPRQDRGGYHVGPMNFAAWVAPLLEVYHHYWFKTAIVQITVENCFSEWPYRFPVIG